MALIGSVPTTTFSSKGCYIVRSNEAANDTTPNLQGVASHGMAPDSGIKPHLTKSGQMREWPQKK